MRSVFTATWAWTLIVNTNSINENNVLIIALFFPARARIRSGVANVLERCRDYYRLVNMRF
jgi:hypothetical protein